jgi:NADH-quinone oxidoreductase subunit C
LEPIQIAEKIKGKFPDAVVSMDEYRGQASVVLKKEGILDVAQWLHDDPEMQMKLLRDVCGVDYLGKKEPRFEVVYHLYSIEHRHMIRLKAQVSEDDASIQSVTPVWEGANFHERECYDMFGIKFEGHPDLRRVLLPEDWQGHPLRKDYPLEGPGPENEWPGFKEVLEKAEKFKEFEWNR